MPLADVLQWAEASRCSGRLRVERAGGSLELFIRHRSIVRLEAPRVLPAPMGSLGVQMDEDLPPQASARAVDYLLDVFLHPEGEFTLIPGDTPGDGLVVDLPLTGVVMEGLQYLDEWPAVRARYPSDLAVLTVAEEPAHGLGAVQRGLLACARQSLNLRDAALALGISRPAVLRRTEELRRLGAVEVEGAAVCTGELPTLLRHATALLSERQYDEAAHILRNLLDADPGALPARRLLAKAEHEQLQALRRQYAGDLVPSLRAQGSARANPRDQPVLELINGRDDIAVLVLTSPLREVETLKSIRRLHRAKVIRLHRLDVATT
jgi:DNA-binding Lrp family transcriptional regulator